MGLNKTGLIVGHVWFTRHLDQVFTLVAKWIHAYAYGVTQTHALVYMDIHEPTSSLLYFF